VSRNLSTPMGVERIEVSRVRVRSVDLRSEREVEVTDGGREGDDMMVTSAGKTCTLDCGYKGFVACVIFSNCLPR